jgi:hypothetical protein
MEKQRTSILAKISELHESGASFEEVEVKGVFLIVFSKRTESSEPKRA